MERRRHLNDETSEPSELSVEFDVSTGQMRCLGVGLWSVRQANAYFADWRAIVRRVHDAGVSVSALVDMTGSGVQKADVAEIIAGVTSEMYRDGDAIAMLVSTSLAKMQMRRVLDGRYHGFFVSRQAAEAWLETRAAPSERS